MRSLLLIATILGGQITFGQNSKDTTITKWALDSLRFQLWQESGTINSMHWAYKLKAHTYNMDTVSAGND